MNLDKLSYTIPKFVEATGISREVITAHIKANNLVLSYPSTRGVILRAEGERWLASLPAEKQKTP